MLGIIILYLILRLNQINEKFQLINRCNRMFYGLFTEAISEH